MLDAMIVVKQTIIEFDAYFNESQHYYLILYYKLPITISRLIFIFQEL